MANEVQEIEAGARINHPVYRDVYNTTFEKSEIVDFEMDGSGVLSGKCEVGDHGWLSVFYHCKKHCYTEEVATLEDNDALNGGVMAFEVGHEVKVLLEKEKAKFVVDHFEQHNPPYMCVDIFRLDYVEWNHEEGSVYYRCSVPEEFSGTDYYGDTPNCDQEEIILFGQKEFTTGTVMNYWGDRFIKLGPVFYIVRIDSVGLPGVLTKPFTVFKGVWTPERETKCIELGMIAESTIGGFLDPLPTWPNYPDVVLEKNLASVLDEKFGGFRSPFGDPRGPAPRWVKTKFYGQSYEI